MIYLLDGTEFTLELNWSGKAKYMSADFSMSNLIADKLKLASQTNELIHTQWLRGIGKTHMLIEFARMHGYLVVEPFGIGVDAIIERENYDDIYSNSISILRGKENKNIIIDEGVTNLQELRDAGFNIITGYLTRKKEDNNPIPFKEKVMKTLVDEIDALTPKLQKTRENKDYGTYKNLINAYREILNLIQNHAKTYGML